MKFLVDIKLPEGTEVERACMFIKGALIVSSSNCQTDSPFASLTASDIEVRETRAVVNEAMERVFAAGRERLR